ncbi:MAG: PQQ-dependent sugar dehydrogenase [Candidatus Hydrogenedentes bacterium]|nr:PQQ-dependent sugar dehydrogenase [Candidatus Hydrogenedentota bacterium]
MPSLLRFVLMSTIAASVHATPLAAELVASGFDKPLYVASPPNDTERLFVLEQHTGLIRIVRDGSIAPGPFLDIGGLVSTGGEQGLLGLAFHPLYASNGFFYIYYTDIDGTSRIMRYTRSADPDIADSSSAMELFFILQPLPNHNGGMMAFGPDGYLYISSGDGGGFSFDRAQDPAEDLGKILRVDVDGGTPYAIPPDNPYANVPGANPRVWARGLRNPWRFSFDALTGDMWIGDVGQLKWEEINFQAGGTPGDANYGWNIAEALDCNRPPTGQCGNNPGFTPPITFYGRDDGSSITGGYVYRGLIPGLQGTYFYADFITSRIWSFRFDGATITEFQERTAELDPPGPTQINHISSFGEDSQRNLYIVDYTGGEIFRIGASPGLDVESTGGAMVLVLAISAAALSRASSTRHHARSRRW